MLAWGGLIVTVATGTAPTVTVAVPLCPSLLAVIVTFPGETPVTTPPDETVAMALSLLDQPTMRPGRTLPVASSVVAESVTVCPAAIALDDGVTDTLATGTCLTMTTAEPCFPSTEATMMAFPGE